MLSTDHKTSIYIVIPARFASTRLPGKPMLKIGSKTMIARVIDRAQTLMTKLKMHNKVSQVNLVVATDHEEIYKESKQCNAIAVMTSPNLRNGTERVFSALQTLKNENTIDTIYEVKPNDIVVNIQGDEPFFSIDDVQNIIYSMLEQSHVPLGTLALKRTDPKLFFSSSVVKVLRDKNNFALYFTRAPAPFPIQLLKATGNDWLNTANAICNEKNSSLEIPFLHHIGVYVFRYFALETFATKIQFGNLEQLESLEQLRVLEEGWKILVTNATQEPLGIDTPEDLAKAQEFA